jgi:hypothetical protein
LGSSEANGGMSLVWYENPTGPGNVVQVGLNSSTPGSMTVTTGDLANTSYVWDFDNTGNLTLPTGGALTTTGNVTGNFFIGNGSQLTGIVAAAGSNIANGNSNVSIATANGNVTITAVGNTTMTVTGTGANITGTLNATGNISGANISATGTLTSTGNISGANISATGTLTSTGKIGYASGSTVTQLTSRGTGVTINALAGTIITTSAAMVATEIDTFSVTNSSVDPSNDIVLAQIVSPNQGTYNCIANPATIGGFNPGFFLNIVNISGFTTSDETITIRFMVIKAPNA